MKYRNKILGYLNCIRNVNLSYSWFGYNYINFKVKGIIRIKLVSIW